MDDKLNHDELHLENEDALEEIHEEAHEEVQENPEYVKVKGRWVKV